MTKCKHLQNVYMVLVHEEIECVFDLIDNLLSLDKESYIIVYDGSINTSLFKELVHLNSDRVIIYPTPHAIKWGRLHEYFVECVYHLENIDYDIITVVDSDQLMLRSGYIEYISCSMKSEIGVLSSNPVCHGRKHSFDMAICAHRERRRWLSFFSELDPKMQSFVHWTFWPATVIGKRAAFATACLLGKTSFSDLIATSRIWASEEVFVPTLAKAAGHEILINPCSLDWVKWKVGWSIGDLSEAMNCLTAFFIHPVPRKIDHPVRVKIREMLRVDKAKH